MMPPLHAGLSVAPKLRASQFCQYVIKYYTCVKLVKKMALKVIYKTDSIFTLSLTQGILLLYKYKISNPDLIICRK